MRQVEKAADKDGQGEIIKNMKVKKRVLSETISGKPIKAYCFTHAMICDINNSSADVSAPQN